MSRKIQLLVFIAIPLISLAMHWPHFSKELISFHSWRQTQTQSTINNFYEGNMNILNPTRNERADGDGIFRMEFPLMQWLVALLYTIFGKHLIITRLFMFLIGLLSVTAMYKLLMHLFNNDRLALIGAWCFNFSPCFYYYTINPMPDNLALCCSLWGLAFFFDWMRRRNMYLLHLSAFMLAAGALCKLPFILYFLVPISFSFRTLLSKTDTSIAYKVLISVASYVLLPFAWYITVVPHWQGNPVVAGILKNGSSVGTLLEYLSFNLFSTLPELLLNYGSVLFFLYGFYLLVTKKAYRSSLFPVLLIWSMSIALYFLFEINEIGRVHDYYLFPFYPILFILVSYGARGMLEDRSKTSRYVALFLLGILPVTVYLRMQNRWNPDSPGFNKDLLVHRDELRAAVPKGSLVIAGNDRSHFIFLYYIDKFGWGFQDDDLNDQNLRSMIKKGAQFLYSDSRTIDTGQQIRPFLDTLLLTRGSIRVYRLKSNGNDITVSKAP